MVAVGAVVAGAAVCRAVEAEAFQELALPVADRSNSGHREVGQMCHLAVLPAVDHSRALVLPQVERLQILPNLEELPEDLGLQPENHRQAVQVDLQWPDRVDRRPLRVDAQPADHRDHHPGAQLHTAIIIIGTAGVGDLWPVPQLH